MSQSQQQPMNMVGITGGPVGGGGGPASQQVTAGTPSSGDGVGGPNHIKRLNTAIYDYLLRNSMYDVARGFVKQMEIETDVKKSPNQRGQPNGVAEDSMDIDVAEIKNRPDDLPAPLQLGDGPFLQDWWCQFWDIWYCRRGQGGKGQLRTYMHEQRNAQKQRQSLMAAGGMDMQQIRMSNGAMQPMNNGMMPNELQRQAMQNRQQKMTPQQQQQAMQAQMMRQQQMQGNAMERQGSQMDNMSGPRSGSPGSGEAPSPKRQRLDGNMQPMQQRPGPPNHQQSHQSVEAYSSSIQQHMKTALQKQQGGMTPNAGAGMAGSQGSPMSGLDANAEFYATNGGRGPSLPPNMGMPGQTANAAAAAANQAGANGNHALQDYQMQLMLLEQQNKKRLLMARQEQDSMANPGMPPGPGGFPPGMSPGASGRGGDPSPNALDMRGTPKMNKGMSPNGDMGGRGSPQPGMMNPSMVPEQLRQQMLANGQMMRPPSSHPNMAQSGAPLTQEQMMLMRSQAGQMTNGNWPQGQGPPMMVGQPGQGPPGPNMTPRQQQQPMGPPPAPPAGTGPSSPAQAPAPPTPSQAAKPKPGSKKGEGKKGKKGAQNTSATPASEPEAPPTPTPATPITPMHQNSFAHGQNKNLPNGQQHPNPAQQPGQPPQNQQQPVQPPSIMDQPFGNLDSDGFGIGMDFGALEGGDVLDNFDFDSFLNTGDGDPGLGFDANFAFGDTGLEAGADLTGGN